MSNSTFSGINITGCTNQYLALAVLVFLVLCSEMLGVASNSRARSVIPFVWTLGKQLFNKYFYKPQPPNRKPLPSKVKIKTEV